MLRTPAAGRLAIAAVVAALLPIVVATARAISGDWFPIGDNAFFAVRAMDVGTRHHPLLGTWTSASVAAGVDVNNPGPLFFEVLALPARLFGVASGLAIGSAALNAAAVVGIAVAAHRRGGPLGVLAAMVPTSILLWSMGSELLFDPWQPHSLLVSFLCLLVVVWSVASGDLGAVPWAVLLASLLLQTHLTYAILIPVLAAWALAGLALSIRRRRDEDREGWPTLRRKVTRTAALAVLVLVVCWAQSLYEQLAGQGEGNLSRLARSTGADTEAVGLRTAARLVAAVLTNPPWILRPSFRDTFLAGNGGANALQYDGLPSLPGAVLALAALALVLALCTWDSRRRGDGPGVAVPVTAGAAVFGALLTVAQAPVGVLGLAAHQLRWLWPIGAMVGVAIAFTLVRRVVASGVSVVPVAGALTFVVAGIAAANVPTFNQAAGPSADAAAIPIVAELDRQMGDLGDGGPVLIDLAGVRFAEPYTLALMAVLQRRGIEFVVPRDDEGMVRQLGPTRRFDGTNATRVLLVREGQAIEQPPGTDRVAFVEGLDDDEQAELERLEARLVADLTEEPLRLNAEGREAVAEDVVASPEGMDPETTVESGLLAVLAERELVDADDGLRSRLERLVSLRRAADIETVAVFVGPLSAQPGAQGSS